MAIHDILTAITAEADRQIAGLRAQHERTVADAKAKAVAELERLTAELEAQKRQKCDQLLRKTKQRADQLKRNAVLRRKRAMLDAVYASVLSAAAKQADDAFEPLLRACLTKARAGEIRPAARHEALLKKLVAGHTHFTMGEPIDAQGGFLCVSKTQEHDFRLETIVRDILRPRTELAVSDKLFPAARA